MTTPTQDRELSHPAARAIHAILTVLGMLWDKETDFVAVIALVEGMSADVTALYVDGEAKAADLAELREELCRMAQYIVRLEDANTRHMITESDLKTRLARAAENNEELYRLTSHAVGDATERHLIVSRNRALLDLEIPLPPVKAVAITTPTHYGAPRAAASH